MSVYFIATQDRRFVKIGRSRQFENRLKALRLSCTVELEVLKVIPGHEETEQVYHGRFNGQLIHGEWFRADAEMIDFITSLEADWRRGDTDE